MAESLQRAKRRAQGQNRELAALHGLSLALSRTHDVDEILATGIELLLRVLDLPAGNIHEALWDEGRLRLRISRGLTAEGIAYLREIPLEGTNAGEAARTGRTVIVSDLTQARPLSFFQDVIRRERFRALACVPLTVNDRVWGVLTMLGKEARAFSPEQVQVLEAVKGQLGIALERALLVSELAGSNARLRGLLEAAEAGRRHLETLTRLARSITTTLNPAEVFGAMVQAVVNVFPGNRCSLWVAEGESLKLRAEAGTLAPVDPKPTLRFGQGLAGVVAATRQPLIVADVREDPRVGDREWMKREGFVSYLGLPLIAKDRVQGIFDLLMRNVHHFLPEEVALLESFASQAVVAIDNARLFQEALKHGARAETLVQLNQTMSASLRPDQVLETVRQAAVRLFNAFRVAVWVADEERRVLSLWRPPPSDPLSQPAPARRHFGDGGVGWVAEHREPILFAPLQADERLSPQDRVHNQGFSSLTAIPIQLERRLLGVVSFATTESHQVGAEEEALLKSLAGQAAIALENARLFEETERRRREAEELARVAQSLTESLDVAAVGERIVTSVRELFGVKAAMLRLLHSDGTLRALASAGEAFARNSGGASLSPGMGVAGLAVTEGRPVWSADVLNEPKIPLTNQMRDHQLRTGHHSMIAVPLRAHEKIIGSLGLQDETGRVYSDGEVALLQTFADQAALALENARLFEAERARQEQLDAVRKVGQEVSTELELEPLLHLIVRRAVELAGRSSGIVYTLEDEVLVPRAWWNLGPWLSEVRFRLGQGIPGIVAQSGQAMIVNDYLNSPYVHPLFRRHSAVTALIAMPLISKGRVVGVITINNSQTTRPFTEADEAILTLFAPKAAAAIENARLFEEAEKRTRELQGLIRAGQTVSSSLEREKVLQTIVREAALVMGVEGCYLKLLDPTAKWLTWEAHVGIPAGWVEETPTPVGKGLSGWVGAEGRPLAVLDPTTDPRTGRPDFWKRFGFTSYLGVPVREGERTIGVLSFLMRASHQFTEEEITLACSFADQAAIALKNARLFEAAVSRTRELSALYTVTSAASQSLDLKETLEGSLEGVIDVVGLEAGHISLREGDEMVLVTSRGLPKEIIADVTRVKMGDGLVGSMILHGEPRWFEDLSTDPEYLRLSKSGLAHRLGFRSTIVVPILFSGVPIGVLGLLDRSPHRFSPEEVQLLVGIAQQLAVAINRARLFQETQRAYEELAAAQEQLVQVEKLRAMGEMASGVAHDFNNVLAAIIGRTQLLLQRVEDPELKRWVEVIEQAALDGAQTVRRIQEFTRIRREPPRTAVDIVQVVSDALEVTQPRWRDETQARGIDIRVETELNPVPLVPGNPAELREVLTNLILNALDAMPTGGTLTLRTRADGRAVMEVGDTGVGMSDEVRRRVFDPFFSTKGPRGTGLGLAVAYGIVTRHGGEIQVESREGIGSTFTIHLPYGPIERPPVVPSESTPARPSRILVIDDEEAVREALRDILSLQHVVEEAASGADGIDRFRQTRFDLVFTDLGMAGMSGWQVAKAVNALSPGTPVVLVTGWGVQLHPAELQTEGVARVLTKPFQLAEVLDAVASLLHSKREEEERQ